MDEGAAPRPKAVEPGGPAHQPTTALEPADVASHRGAAAGWKSWDSAEEIRIVNPVMGCETGGGCLHPSIRGAGGCCPRRSLPKSRLFCCRCWSGAPPPGRH